MISSAPEPARREDAASSSAIILPFRLRAKRMEEPEGSGSAPPVAVHANTFSATGDERRSTVVLAADRLAIIPPRYRGWLQQALIAAVLLHLVAFAVMQISFVHDVERAANNGGAAADGTTVLDIEIVAEAMLPPSKTPSNMTAPDATKQTNTQPQTKQEEKKLEAQKAQPAPNSAPQFALPKEELAAPGKAETSEAPQSPNQKKQEVAEPEPKQTEQPKVQEHKKKQEYAAPSIAAAPNRAAGNRGENASAGANGRMQQGGRAEASAYSAMVVAHLMRYRTYPEQARSAHVTGVSTVRFTLGASGNVVAVSLAGSSGAGVLDQAALAMVRRASPFPPIPPSLGRGSMTFAAPVRFNLR